METTVKKIIQLTAFLISFALAACVTAGNKPSDAAAYQTFLSQLPSDDPKSIGAAVDYFHEHFTQSKQGKKEAAFLAFRSFFYVCIDEINKSFQNDAWPEDEEAMEAFVTGIYGNGLAVWSDIDCFIKESDSFLASTFVPEVSAPLQEYLLLREAELKEPYDSDGVLVLPFKQLAQRCVNWERYLEKFPKSPLSKQAQFYYHGYLETLLLGMDNSPVLDNCWSAENKANLLAEIEAAYAFVIQQYPKTKTGLLISEYYPLVKASGFSSSPDVDRFLKVHEQEYSDVPCASNEYYDAGVMLTPDQFRDSWRSASRADDAFTMTSAQAKAMAAEIAGCLPKDEQAESGTVFQWVLIQQMAEGMPQELQDEVLKLLRAKYPTVYTEEADVPAGGLVDEGAGLKGYRGGFLFTCYVTPIDKGKVEMFCAAYQHVLPIATACRQYEWRTNKWEPYANIVRF